MTVGNSIGHNLVMDWLYEVNDGLVVAKNSYRLGPELLKKGIELVIRVKIGYRVGYSIIFTQSSMCWL